MICGKPVVKSAESPPPSDAWSPPKLAASAANIAYINPLIAWARRGEAVRYVNTGVFLDKVEHFEEGHRVSRSAADVIDRAC